jgi:hypothetical protein
MRVFFHIVGQSEAIRDEDGLDVDVDGLCAAVARDVRELLREFPEEVRRGWELHVTDEAGTVLCRIPLDGSHR